MPITPSAPGLFSTTTGWPRTPRELLGEEAGVGVDATAGAEGNDHPQRPVGEIALGERRRHGQGRAARRLQSTFS